MPTAAPVVYASGFYAPETNDKYTFRWMEPAARLEFEADPADRFMELQVHCEFLDLSQELTWTAGDRTDAVSLRAGWAPVSLPVPAGVGAVDLAVNKIFPREYYAPGDGRSLTLLVRDVVFHDDARRHHNVVAQHANIVKNGREMRAGRTELASTPPRIGIDMHGACNVKPPCVYCEWDSNKAIEGDAVDTPFTLETLREWGPIFDQSRTLVNCSIGEPFLMRNLDEILEAFDAGGKELELTTNGQIMTDRMIQKLIGRPIKLHISLDAGTPETYAKLRNNRFDPIIRNLERLIPAKGGRGHYPYIHLVFMPMRLNVHELPLVVDLAARLNVDLLVLRPLNFATESALNWDRAGYRFEYVNELLPFDELVRTSGRAAELCRRAGVPLGDQMDFGGKMGTQFARLFEEGRQSVRVVAEPAEPAAGPEAPSPAATDGPRPDALPSPAPPVAAAPLPSLGGETIPACTEPWESLYILRRGVLPCCYGGHAIAPMEHYREAWNSPLMQEIRRELAAGRFHQYCHESPSCPLVRKTEQITPRPVAAVPDAPAPLAHRLRRRAARVFRWAAPGADGGRA